MIKFLSVRKMFANLMLAAFVSSAFGLSAFAIGTDTDGDHIFDSDEATYGWDASNPDENGNGTIDGEDDYEGDGLSTQSDLYFYFTNPTDLDTDDDGRGDYNEVLVAPTSDPNDVDTDDDGLYDTEYTNFGTDPNDNDTDGDGMGDYYEEVTLRDAGFTFQGEVFDSYLGGGLSDGSADVDEDGRSMNQEQLVDGTDPLVAELPDLEMGMSAYTNLTVASGGTVTTSADLQFSYEVVNNGNAYADVSTTPVRVSLWNQDSGALIEEQMLSDYVSGLDVGASTWVEFASYTHTCGADLNLLLVVDSYNDLYELTEIPSAYVTEANYYRMSHVETEFGCPGSMDLTVTDISLSSSNRIKFTIANLGNGITDPSLDVATTYNVDASGGGGYFSTIMGTNDYLNPYGTQTVQTSYDLTAPGTYSVEVCVDATEVVVEDNEENNCLTVILEPTSEESSGGGSEETLLPDLQVDSVQVWNTGLGDFVTSIADPSTVDPLDYSYYYTVSNMGDAIAGDSSTLGYTVVYGGAELTELAVYDWPNLGNWDFLSVGLSSSFSADELTVVTTDTIHEYPTLLFCVDASALVVESDETNNCLEVSNMFYYVPSTEETETPTESETTTTTTTTETSGGGTWWTGGSSSSGSSSDVILTGSEEVVLTEDEVAACGEMTFEDVTEDTEGYSSIYQLWCEGVIHGRDMTHFVPEDAVKRDEASKIIARLFGYVTTAHEELPEVTGTSYSDVSTEEPLAYYIETLTDEGFYAEEETAGEFRPHEDMTYAEIVEVLSAVSGQEVAVDTYVDSDTMSRGNFVDLVLGLFQ